MYKSKKTWVVAPVVLGALAAGFATAPVAHAEDAVAADTTAVQKELNEAKVEAKAVLTKLQDTIPTLDGKLTEIRSNIENAKSVKEVKDKVDEAYGIAEKEYVDTQAREFDAKIDALNLKENEKAAAKVAVRNALNNGVSLKAEVEANGLEKALENMKAKVAANKEAAQAVVDEAVKKDLAAYKAVKVAEVNALPFLTETEKENVVKDVNLAETAEKVDGAVEKAKEANEAAKAALKAQVQAVINQLENADKKAEFQKALNAAATKEAVEAVRVDAQAALDAQKAAQNLKDKKDALKAQITQDAKTFGVKDADRDAWLKKVDAAKTVAEVDQLSKDWHQALLELAKDAYKFAKAEVEAMKYILPTPKANILESMAIHQNDVAVVKALLEEARAKDAAEKANVLAAIKDAKAEIAKLNLTDAQKKVYNAQLDKVTSVVEANKVLAEAKKAADARNLEAYKQEAKKAIKELTYLSAAQKDELNKQIDAAKDKAAVDAVVVEANKLNFDAGVESGKTLNEKKEVAKKAIEALSDLTEAQKTQYKKDIDQAKTEVEVKQIYKAAHELNEKQKAEREAAEELVKAKKAAKEKVDALAELPQATKDAYKAQIDEAKDLAAVNKVVAAAEAKNKELVDAKARLEQAKKDAVVVIKDKKFLSDQEKADLIRDVYAADTVEAVNNVLAKAEKLATDNELAQADVTKAKVLVKEKINAMADLSNDEKMAYVARVDKATTKDGVVAIYNEASAMDTKHHDDKLVKVIDQALSNREYAKAQSEINKLRDEATKAAKQAELDAAMALSAAKAKAYAAIDGLTEFTPAEKTAERAKVAKMTDVKAIEDYTAALLKEDDNRHDAPYIALAEKLIKQGDMEGAKKAIAKIRNAAEKARLTAMLGLNGWTKVDGKWYYYNKGEMVKGWFLEEKSGNWFYLDPETGVMHTGLTDVDGVLYYFGPLGNMYKGWVNVDGTWYYFHRNLGNAQKGWQLINNKWYYLDKDGKMVTGFYTDKAGSTFYLNEKTGEMHTGWFNVKGKYYYARENGSLVKGWILDKGKWYYTNEKGEMVSNTSLTIKGVKYHFNIAGVWVR